MDVPSDWKRPWFVLVFGILRRYERTTALLVISIGGTREVTTQPGFAVVLAASLSHFLFCGVCFVCFVVMMIF